MEEPRIDIPKAELAEFCRHNHIRRLALFGSVLRDDFRPNSDVDVLVEFEPGQTPGLRFFDMEIELSEMLGRKVDLVTWRSVESSRNWLRRKHILEHLETIHVEG